LDTDEDANPKPRSRKNTDKDVSQRKSPDQKKYP